MTCRFSGLFLLLYFHHHSPLYSSFSSSSSGRGADIQLTFDSLCVALKAWAFCVAFCLPALFVQRIPH